ncbi:40S ribosomal protein s7 [Phtheirospermum japonicum]|uniref:40S ribosomal protein s7 n=1 Tax=Phtheirospermum japonicum TaxID=374723 RepID=A0A830D780_9LAMI|nr:40S ribosomal protein s7 [Phtheirospermum japonicum]
MSSVSVAPPTVVRDPSQKLGGLDRLPDELNEMKLKYDKSFKMYTASQKIHKDKDAEPTEFEENVAQEFGIQNGPHTNSIDENSGKDARRGLIQFIPFFQRNVLMKLLYYDDVTLILVTHPKTSDLRDSLKYIYNLYVEYVVKNPLYSPGSPIM